MVHLSKCGALQTDIVMMMTMIMTMICSAPICPRFNTMLNALEKRKEEEKKKSDITDAQFELI